MLHVMCIRVCACARTRSTWSMANVANEPASSLASLASFGSSWNHGLGPGRSGVGAVSRGSLQRHRQEIWSLAGTSEETKPMFYLRGFVQRQGATLSFVIFVFVVANPKAHGQISGRLPPERKDSHPSDTVLVATLEGAKPLVDEDMRTGRSCCRHPCGAEPFQRNSTSIPTKLYTSECDSEIMSFQSYEVSVNHRSWKAAG